MPSSDSILQCPTRREVFEASLAGAQTRPFIPRLRSDPPPYQPLPHSLVEFRVQEGRENREHRLKQLWYSLPKKQKLEHDESEDEKVAKECSVEGDHTLTAESAQRLEEMYQDELVSRCRKDTAGFLHRNISWLEFQKYAEAKETGACCPRVSHLIQITNFSWQRPAELWHIFHDELDLDGNGHLDAEELTSALQKAGEYS